MAKPESKYRFMTQPDGFRVEAKDRTPVTVQCLPTHFEVVYETRDAGLELPLMTPNEVYRIGLYQYRKLIEAMAQGLMVDWKPPERERPGFPGIGDWAVRQTAKALGRRAYERWARHLESVDPVIRSVQRSVFAATLQCCQLVVEPEFYRQRHLVSDVANHRAAAMAAVNIERLLDDQHRIQLLKSDEVRFLRSRVDEAAYSLQLDLARLATEASTDETIEAMQDWPSLFSCDSSSYRSLRRTLMRLPGGVPHGLVCGLNRVRLERPVTERLELLTACLFAQAPREQQINRRVFLNARVPQIKEALSRVAAHTRNTISPRRTRDVRWLVRYLCDFPEIHRGNLVGLAEKSIRWHRRQDERYHQDIVDRLGADTPLAAPPISFPEQPGFRRLTTVAELCEEGTSMGHCIASYAERAVHGHSYYFHVEHDGESATVEVDRSGSVVQASGPRNNVNPACAFGARQLRVWGRRFPDSNRLIEDSVFDHGVDAVPF